MQPLFKELYLSIILVDYKIRRFTINLNIGSDYVSIPAALVKFILNSGRYRVIYLAYARPILVCYNDDFVEKKIIRGKSIRSSRVYLNTKRLLPSHPIPYLI